MPWVALLVGVMVADVLTDVSTVRYDAVAAVSPLYLAFVSLPTYLVLVVAGPGRLSSVLLLGLTALAAGSGYEMISSEDGQAGLAILIVPQVALPLACILAVCWSAQPSVESG